MLPENLRLWLWAGLLTLGVAGFAEAEQVRLELEDGREITAELIGEDSSGITVSIAGIETTFPHDEVRNAEVLQSLEDAYRERRQELDRDDWSGRYQLARWLYEQDTEAGYRLALQELESLLQDRPSHQQAQLLERVVTTRLRQEQQQREQRELEPEAATADISAIERQRAMTLDEQQIALLKAFEVDLDRQPTVRVPREVVDELFERYRAEPALRPFLGREGRARFLRMPGYEQLAVLFELRARELYDQVAIRTEPETLREFRTGFHPNYAVRYCGQCHGENTQAPGLQLLTRRFTDDATAYTNLLILRRTYAGDYPLIYMDDPMRSPLVQYGLPREAAITPHPDVPRWRPYFNGLRDPRLDQMLQWINRLYQGRYPIDFEPPGQPETDDPSFDTTDAVSSNAWYHARS